MKTILLLGFATIAMFTWVLTAIAVERHRESLHGAAVVNADYQHCVTVPVPVPSRRRIDLHPGNSELS